MNAFADYAKKAQSIVDAPQRLVGSIKRRADARLRYSEIVTELDACTDEAMFSAYLASINGEIVQFHAELPFLWEGDGDFPGLQREIERTTVRLNDGLDYPRYEKK